MDSSSISIDELTLQVYGDFEDISNGNEQVFAYTRTLDTTTALVLLNFNETDVSFTLETDKDWSGFTLMLGNYDRDGALQADVTLKSGSILLKGWEGRLYVRSL